MNSQNASPVIPSSASQIAPTSAEQDEHYHEANRVLLHRPAILVAVVNNVTESCYKQ